MEAIPKANKHAHLMIILIKSRDHAKQKNFIKKIAPKINDII
jgi:hypothetical protein